MKLGKLGRLELKYTEPYEEVPYEAGGQSYGIMVGTLEGPELKGTLHLSNFAPLRTDAINGPTLRGVLTTHDGAKLAVTADGLSVKDPPAVPPRRLVTMGITFRTADPRYSSLNRVYVLGELEGKAMGEHWGVTGQLYRCIPEI